jgi:hypothetical protein
MADDGPASAETSAGAGAEPSGMPSKPRKPGGPKKKRRPGTKASRVLEPQRSWTRREYLEEVLTVLWPPPARIIDNAARTGDSTGYALLPWPSRPTLMVPTRPRRATASAVRNYKASATAGMQARLVAVSVAAARLGLAELLSGRIGIDSSESGPRGTIQSYLSDVLGQPVVVGLHIGAPGRANLKPVLQLLTADGRTFGFAKVGMRPLTQELVIDEGRALARLNAKQLTHLQVPELLHRGRWQGHEVLVQAALTRSGPAAVDPYVLRAAMRELAAVKGIRTSTAVDSPFWTRLGRRLEALPPSSSADALTAQWELLTARARGTELTFGSWHGDWTPWNMSMSTGKALVWDWERFGSPVPIGFDALHYRLHRSIAQGGADAAAAARALITGAGATLSWFGVPAEVAPLVAAAYLVEIGSRYLADGQAEAGAALGDLEQWLLPALRAHAGQSTRPSGDAPA